MTEKDENIGDSNQKQSLYKRYDWLDQFRGIVVILLIISGITWVLSGDWSGTDPILGPTLLNHGFQYYDGYPPLITIIDIGQQIFMFVMGFVGYISFSSRLKKYGPKKAWKHGMRRILLLYLLAFIDDGLLEMVVSGAPDWKCVLYGGILANLAIGSFAGYLAIYLIHDADKRILLSIGIMIFHSIMYALPYFEHYHTQSGVLFPFISINHAAIAIAGTCFSQWFKLDPENPQVGFKKRILPAALLSYVAFYCIDWLQYAEHHDVTTSLALAAIGTSGFMIAIFYGFEQLGFKIPLLSEFGKNLLLMFILSLFISIYVQAFSKDFLVAFPILALLLIGILPILPLAGIALFLDRKNIIIKF